MMGIQIQRQRHWDRWWAYKYKDKDKGHRLSAWSLYQCSTVSFLLSHGTSNSVNIEKREKKHWMLLVRGERAYQRNEVSVGGWWLKSGVNPQKKVSLFLNTEHWWLKSSVNPQEKVSSFLNTGLQISLPNLNYCLTLLPFLTDQPFTGGAVSVLCWSNVCLMLVLPFSTVCLMMVIVLNS